MFDNHVHSNFSLDTNVSMESVVKKSIKLNIEELTFTDHMDYNYFFGKEKKEFIFNPKLYSEEIKRLQEKYKNNIVIHKGIELGLQNSILLKAKQLLEKNEFDFVLASIHCIENNSLTNYNYFEKYSIDKLWENYFLETLSIINKFNNFDVIAHLDVPVRYNKRLHNSSIKRFYPILEEICSCLVNTGRGIEVNSGGYRYNLNDNNPSLDILKIYKKMGGEIITFGSDSHTLEELNYRYAHTISTLKEVGFTYINTFKKRKAIFHKI